MKSFSSLFIFFLVIACGGPKSDKVVSASTETVQATDESSETKRTEQFVKEYIAAVNSDNWKEEVLPFLSGDPNVFFKGTHSFPELLQKL